MFGRGRRLQLFLQRELYLRPAAAFAQMLLERFAIARDDSQSSTRQGELGGAAPSADFAIIVVDLL